MLNKELSNIQMTHLIKIRRTTTIMGFGIIIPTTVITPIGIGITSLIMFVAAIRIMIIIETIINL